MRKMFSAAYWKGTADSFSVKNLIGALGFLIIYSVAAGILIPGFFAAQNVLNILRSVSVIGIMACGITFVMLTGNIDLSCGALMSLTACVSCQLIDVSPLLALITPLLIGGVLGAVNGFLVGKLKLNSFLTTLALLSIYQALTFLYTKGQYLSSTSQSWYRELGQGNIFGIPILVILFITVTAVCDFVQRRTAFGARLYAVGSNQVYARFSGIRATSVSVFVYVISGVLSAFSGVLLCARSMAAQPKMGNGYEFDVLIAVLIGGLSVTSGRGSAYGTLIGVLFLGVIKNSFSFLGLGAGFEYVAEGVLLFAAIVIQTVLERRERA